jgi:hypothetical protein
MMEFITFLNREPETFGGRRKQFAECVLFTVVQDIVKSVCPLLRFQPFVSRQTNWHLIYFDLFEQCVHFFS